VSDDQTDRPELDAVRRLLADARHTDPVPADVADRMDAVLADMSRQRADEPGTAEVIPLDARRRRRAAGLLVAAAAIVVGGVAAAQQLSPDAGSPVTASTNADRATSSFSSQGSDAGGTTTPESQTPGLQRGHASGAHLQTKDGGVLVRPRRFTDDALAGLRLLHGKVPGLDDRSALMSVSSHCVRTPAGSDAVRATYRRAPAALVYHRPAGSTQVVDLFVCGSSRPIRSVTLPVP
jgi:hypothetical protein